MSYYRCTDGTRITPEEMIERVRALGFDDQDHDVPVPVRSARRRRAGVEPWGHQGDAERGCHRGCWYSDYTPAEFELKAEAEGRS